MEKKKEEKELKIKTIIEMIRKNKGLPLNEIKRLVKKEYPDINIDTLIDIITEKQVLSNKEEPKMILNKKVRER